MAGTLGSLIVDIGADVARLRKDMGKATKTVNGAMDLIKKSVSAATSAIKGFGISFLSGFSVTAIRNVIGEFSSLYDASQKLGLSAESLQKYQYAALQVGVSQNAATTALQRFVRMVGEAQQGSGALEKTLRQYRIALKDSNGQLRSSEEILGDYADAIKNANTDNEKLVLSFKGFQSEGVAFANILRNGREGLKQFGDEAENAGFIIEQSVVEKAKELDGKITLLAKTISTKFKAAILDVSLAISDLFDDRPIFDFGKALDENREKVRQLKEQLIELENARVPRRSGRQVASPASLRIKEINEQIERLEKLDPDKALADINQRIALAQNRSDSAVGRIGKSAEIALKRLKQERELILQAIEAGSTLIDIPSGTGAPPPLPSSGAKRKSPAEQAREMIEALREQQAQLGFTAEQVKLYDASLLAAKLSNESLKGELLATAEAFVNAQQEFDRLRVLEQEAQQVRESLKTPYDLAFDSIERYDEMQRENMLTMEEWGEAVSKALKKAADETERLEKAGRKAKTELEKTFEKMGNTIERSISRAVAQSKISLESLADLATSIFEAIASSLVTTYIARPIATGIEGFINDIFRADGGPVVAGQSYIVGERGPELFTPGASGMITPNNRIGVGGGQLTVNLNVQSLDPRTAASVILENRDSIVAIMRDAFARSGRAVRLA